MLEEEKKKAVRKFLDEDTSQSSSQEESDIDLFAPSCSTAEPPCKKTKYNTEDISNIALASLRHHTGLREAAEIATAAWIDAGLITKQDTHLIIDHNKLKRAQEKITMQISEEFETDIRESPVNCILFDGRKDDTKTQFEVEGSSKKFPGLIQEEHYSVCSEPGGKYLFHFVPEEASKKRKHAEVIADQILAWLKDRGADKTLQAIGGDSTNVNTGWEGGVMKHLETKLGRRLVWIVCDLHTGELGLRHLIIALDGPTISNNKWSGKLGKMLDDATDLEINPKFPKIDSAPQLPQLSEEVIRDLSTDQSYAYRITEAIRTGVLPEGLALLEIGPVSHSRWLTTALRFCRIWVSKHGLRKKQQENLQLIVEYIVGVYIPNWFTIKTTGTWVEGPRHLLYQLQQLQKQKKKVIELVSPTVQRSAWYARPDVILQAMLCSEEQTERQEAVNKIQLLRGQDQLGDSSVKPRKTPNINFKATKISELVDWSTEVLEPPLTIGISTEDLSMFVDRPMVVPAWPSHTQSVERCVKMVTEASSHVFSHERRESYIRAQVVSREIMSRNNSKQDMLALAQSKY